MRSRHLLRIVAVFLSTCFVASCSSLLRSVQAPKETTILARNNNYAVVIVGRKDTLHSLADRILGDPAKYWLIADANDVLEAKSGQELVIPIKPSNPTGVRTDGYQTIPILNYHRFGGSPGRKLWISKKVFEEQMAYLHGNDYRVIPLSDLVPFLYGEKPLPRRSVIITIDDGHRSIYDVAFPILKKYGFPATLFVYSDYINNGGLSSKQITAMIESGLISVQPHSKTHKNLALRHFGDSEESYRRNVTQEVSWPAKVLEERFQQPPVSYAYPFGDTNQYVIGELIKRGYKAGLTVQPGGNPAFSFPFLLYRTMIFGDESMAEFRSALQTFTPTDLK